jgi:hypothetical protein
MILTSITMPLPPDAEVVCRLFSACSSLRTFMQN